MRVSHIYSTVDTHVYGEAFRVVVDSSIRLGQGTIEQAQAELSESFKFEKNVLLNEPRGHRGMNGCIVLPSEQSDFSIAFFNHDDSVQFKQEALMAVTTALIETGRLQRKDTNVYQVETAYGRYAVAATIEEGEVVAITVEVDRCQQVEQAGASTTVCIGHDRKYIVYDLPSKIRTIDLPNLAFIEEWGIAKVRQLAQEGVSFEGVVLVEEIAAGQVRSVTFEKDGYILRTPGIDATVGIAAVKEVKTLTNTSIFNSSLRIEKSSSTVEKGVFTVRGEAFVTGSHDFLVDEEDPLQNGFLLA